MSVRIVKINNVDIATFGLRLQQYNGHLDQSAKKRILAVFEETAETFYEDRKIVFEFYGQFDNQLDLGNAVYSFSQTVFQNVEGGVYIIPPNTNAENPHQLWIGRFVYGMQVRLGVNNSVFITLAMKWQGKSFS